MKISPLFTLPLVLAFLSSTGAVTVRGNLPSDEAFNDVGFIDQARAEGRGGNNALNGDWEVGIVEGATTVSKQFMWTSGSEVGFSLATTTHPRSLSSLWRALL